MLAKKYYAQKGNSKGKMNTLSLSGTTYSRINRLKIQQVDPSEFKRVPEIPQSQYIKEKMIREIQCTDVSFSGGNPTCANNGICNITKDLDTKSQGVYVERIYSKKCILDESLKKPFVKNIIGNHGC